MIFKKKNKRVFWFRVLSLVFLSCFFWGGSASAYLGDSLIKGMNVIFYGIYVLANMLFGLSMWLLDFVISPDNYKAIFFSSGAIEGINSAWGFVRDFFNMFFILIIVLVGISTILGVSNFKDKAIIIRVAFAAMLINFSKPITLFVIDVSQVFTNFFATALSQNDYVSLLGRLINFGEIIKGTGDISSDSSFTVVILMSTVMVLILAVMIFFLGITLVIRYIAFQILIILSPLAMFGFAMEGTKISSMKEDWVKKLISWSFYAPILLFFMWVALILVNGVQEAVFDTTKALNSTTNIQSLNTNNGISEFLVKVAGVLVPYITAIYLLFYGYDKAKDISDKSANKVLSRGREYIDKWGDRAKGLYRRPINFAKDTASDQWKHQKELTKEGWKTKMDTMSKKGSISGVIGKTGKWFTEEAKKERREKQMAQFKETRGKDGGAAMRKYNTGKAQEKIKEWKDNPPSKSDLKAMFEGKKGDEAQLAAILYKSQNNQINNGKEYEDGLKYLRQNKYKGLREDFKKKAKKENMGAVMEHKLNTANLDWDNVDDRANIQRVYKKSIGSKGLKDLFKNQNKNFFLDGNDLKGEMKSYLISASGPLTEEQRKKVADPNNFKDRNVYNALYSDPVTRERVLGIRE